MHLVFYLPIYKFCMGGQYDKNDHTAIHIENIVMIQLYYNIFFNIHSFIDLQ